MAVALSPRIETIPTGGACGAEVRGVDAAQPLSPEARDTIKQALFAHGVVYLRNQKVTDAQLVSFGRNFSDLHAYPVTEYEKPPGLPPEVELISNILVDGKPIGALGSGEATWHSDMSMFDVPASFTYLYAEKVPPTGGNTRFANLYAAYDALPDDLKRKVEGRKSIHDIAYIADGRLRPPYQHVTDKSKGPGAHHPVVRTHPDSGRRALYLGRKGYGYIFDYPVPESDALLDALWDHMTSPRFIWEHVWQVGDILIWDNRGVAHSRGTLDPTLPRLMRRIIGMGERRSEAAMPIYRTRRHAESYGQAVGILLLDGRAPFVPGDVGNASSYDYPVVYKTVEGLTTMRCLNREPGWEGKVVDAAKELERQGVRGISSDCGFMIQYQDAVCDAVRIPVFLSTLLQLPFIGQTLAPDRPIGVVTADSGNFNQDFMRRTDTLPYNPIIIRGLQNEPEFGTAVMREKGTQDSELIADEVEAACRDMVRERHDLAAILLECSLPPPYAKRVQDALGLPVFDFVSLIDYAESGTRQRRYAGDY